MDILKDFVTATLKVIIVNLQFLFFFKGGLYYAFNYNKIFSNNSSCTNNFQVKKIINIIYNISRIFIVSKF